MTTPQEVISFIGWTGLLALGVCAWGSALGWAHSKLALWFATRKHRSPLHAVRYRLGAKILRPYLQRRYSEACQVSPGRSEFCAGRRFEIASIFRGEFE